MQTFCKSKAIMSYLSSDDPYINEDISRYENWALAYDLLINLGHLNLQEIEEIWQEKTQTQFAIWNVISNSSITEVIEYITEEYTSQVITIEQFIELQSGMTFDDI